MKRIASGTIPFDATSRDPAMIARGRIAVPFAALSDELAGAIGAEARAVMLSVADATKQVEKRRTRADEKGRTDLQVTPGRYWIVQALIDAGEAIAQGATLVLQGFVEGEYWHAAIRRAGADASELYLKSLRRADPERAGEARARGDVVRRSGE